MSVGVGEHDAIVLTAALTQFSTGTLGMQILFETAEGRIDHIVWLTPKAKRRATDTLRVLGVTAEDMRDATFWSNPTERMAGRACRIVAGQDRFRGRRARVVTNVRAIEIAADKRAADAAVANVIALFSELGGGE